jgi:hypothetical protein
VYDDALLDAFALLHAGAIAASAGSELAFAAIEACL